MEALRSEWHSAVLREQTKHCVLRIVCPTYTESELEYVEADAGTPDEEALHLEPEQPTATAERTLAVLPLATVAKQLATGRYEAIFAARRTPAGTVEPLGYLRESLLPSVVQVARVRDTRQLVAVVGCEHWKRKLKLKSPLGQDTENELKLPAQWFKFMHSDAWLRVMSQRADLMERAMDLYQQFLQGVPLSGHRENLPSLGNTNPRKIRRRAQHVAPTHDLRKVLFMEACGCVWARRVMPDGAWREAHARALKLRWLPLAHTVDKRAVAEAVGAKPFDAGEGDWPPHLNAMKLCLWWVPFEYALSYMKGGFMHRGQVLVTSRQLLCVYAENCVPEITIDDSKAPGFLLMEKAAKARFLPRAKRAHLKIQSEKVDARLAQAVQGQPTHPVLPPCLSFFHRRIAQAVLPAVPAAMARDKRLKDPQRWVYGRAVQAFGLDPRAILVDSGFMAKVYGSEKACKGEIDSICKAIKYNVPSCWRMRKVGLCVVPKAGDLPIEEVHRHCQKMHKLYRPEVKFSDQLRTPVDHGLAAL